MRFAAFAIAVAFLCSPAVAEQPLVTFVSPSECQGFHGKNRWVTKTDLSPVPLDKSAIQSVTPSQIYEWEGPGPNVPLTRTTETRMPSKQLDALTACLQTVSARREASKTAPQLIEYR